MKRGYVVNMAERNKCRALMGPPCKMMDGSKRWSTMQYGGSRGLMNMPIHTMGDSRDHIQIKVTSSNWSKNFLGREVV